MKICFISSEVHPFAKTGGLADVSGALAKYLDAAGYDIRVFMPLYSSIDFTGLVVHSVDFLRNRTILIGNERISYSVFTTTLPGSNADIYLIDCPRFFHRGTIYTNHEDEYLRFAFLSRVTIECCQQMGWGPDVFHYNDWQTALIPLLLRTAYKWDSLFRHSKTVLTIHNLAYQGVFSAEAVTQIGLGEWREKFYREDLDAGIVNYLKTGIMYADLLTTVSETYAREIQTPEYGNGLEGELQKRSPSLVGIVNGVDYSEWGPEGDRFLPRRYSVGDREGKEENKRYLLNRVELPYEPDVPVFGIVSRLTPQKGFDLFFDILYPFISHNNIRLVVLGSGDAKYEEFFDGLQSYFPEKVCFYNGFQNELAHLIEAGSDIFLMPSRYEPCGLNQIYSLKYGTIPIVRKTGGLADTVQQWHPESSQGTGFVFEHYTAQGLEWAMDQAIQTWHHKDQWHQLMVNAMSRNYSWEQQVQKYIQLYNALARMN